MCLSGRPFLHSLDLVARYNSSAGIPGGARMTKTLFHLCDAKHNLLACVHEKEGGLLNKVREQPEQAHVAE